MLVILKIPLVYLGVVVWWAVRAEPDSSGGGDEAGVRAAPLTPCNWDDWRRSRSRTRSRLSDSPVRSARDSTRPGDVSAIPAARRADRVAGFLCAFSFALSGIAIARTPGLLATAAVIVALVAARMTQTHRTLAAVAVGVAGAAFVLGMTVAVLTDSGIY